MSPDLELVGRLYAAFAAGDLPTFLSQLHPQVRLNEAQINPLSDGNPYVGAEPIVNRVFLRLAEDFADFRVQVDEICGGEGVVTMLGRYHADARATGKKLDAQVQHTWWLEGGKVVRFQQMVDTAALLAALS